MENADAIPSTGITLFNQRIGLLSQAADRSDESKRQIEGVADREESDKSGRWTEGKMADRGGSQGG